MNAEPRKLSNAERKLLKAALQLWVGRQDKLWNEVLKFLNGRKSAIDQMPALKTQILSIIEKIKPL